MKAAYSIRESNGYKSATLYIKKDYTTIILHFHASGDEDCFYGMNSNIRIDSDHKFITLIFNRTKKFLKAAPRARMIDGKPYLDHCELEACLMSFKERPTKCKDFDAAWDFVNGRTQKEITEYTSPITGCTNTFTT